MTTNERIKKAGWFDGTEADWWALSREEREERSFKALGCLCAFPTWAPKDWKKAGADCVHTDCQVRRGEIKPIEKTRRILGYERESGWLRFMPERAFKKLRKAILSAARQTGIYDPWEIPGGWQGIVFGGILGEKS